MKSHVILWICCNKFFIIIIISILENQIDFVNVILCFGWVAWENFGPTQDRFFCTSEQLRPMVEAIFPGSESM
jgi:hypothetical protein